MRGAGRGEHGEGVEPALEGPRQGDLRHGGAFFGGELFAAAEPLHVAPAKIAAAGKAVQRGGGGGVLRFDPAREHPPAEGGIGDERRLRLLIPIARGLFPFARDADARARPRVFDLFRQPEVHAGGGKGRQALLFGIGIGGGDALVPPVGSPEGAHLPLFIQGAQRLYHGRDGQALVVAV